MYNRSTTCATVSICELHFVALFQIPDYKGAKWRGTLELEASSSYRTHLRVKLGRIDEGGNYNGEYTKMVYSSPLL